MIASALPGDEAQIRVGKRDDLTTAQRNHLVALTRKELGLDKPYPVQWAIWLEKVVQGDFGSQEGGGSVGKAVLQRIIPSLELTLVVLLVSLPTAALLAVSAVRHGKRVVAKGFGQLLTVGFLFPQFWLAIVLVVIFAVELHWLPASGYTSFSQNPGQHIEHLILPVLALSIPTAALYYRYLRQSLQDVLQTQYIRTARAKGVSESTVLYRHALPNALIPSLSVLGIQFGQLLGGVVVIELILNWPGVGGLLMYSVQAAGQQHADRRGDGDRLCLRRRLDDHRDPLPHHRPADPESLNVVAARTTASSRSGCCCSPRSCSRRSSRGCSRRTRPTRCSGRPSRTRRASYLLGTDESGRDILSRLIYAARADLAISLSATLIAAVIGVAIGLAAGYRGGNWSTVCLRVTDVMLAFPSLLLALFLIAVVGPSDTIVVIALVILYVPGFMRLSRGLALQLRERSFIEASHISGGGPLYIVRRHLVPNAMGPLLVGISLTAAYSLLAAATLSYLGLGAPPPAPSWGSMSQAAYNYLFQDW